MVDLRILAVIPARGGSSGIPKKNIVDLMGKPLIHYSISSALKCDLISDLVVSTDSEEIASVARSEGAQAPFLRPNELSSDRAQSLPVITHALDFMEDQTGIPYDAVMMLQPTSPLRSAADIEASVEVLKESGADSVISVVRVESEHPLRMKRIVGGALINYIDQGHEDMRPRQDLPPVYIRNGAIYLARSSVIREFKSFTGASCAPLVMPKERSINIDNLEDLWMAERYLETVRKR